MPAVQETCPCGASLVSDGLYTSRAVRDFRTIHEGCRRPVEDPLSRPGVAEGGPR